MRSFYANKCVTSNILKHGMLMGNYTLNYVMLVANYRFCKTMVKHLLVIYSLSLLFYHIRLSNNNEKKKSIIETIQRPESNGKKRLFMFLWRYRMEKITIYFKLIVPIDLIEKKLSFCFSPLFINGSKVWILNNRTFVIVPSIYVQTIS